ncbi:MAG: SpoIID/LytB domain-containing protein [Acidobacteria bacterium]|nr:SpoIID/LytB domain-containing protein [Acidobacteriota bacterium]
MRSTFIIGQVFSVLLLLLIGVSPVMATENSAPELKIGLFNLLKPKKIDIKLVDNEVVLIKTFFEGSENNLIKSSQPILFTPKETLSLVATNKGIICYLKNPNKEIKRQWIAKTLSLSGNGSLEFYVANRLTRQIPAKVNFQLSKDLLQTILFTDEETSVEIITASELSAIDNINSKQALESFKALSITIRSYLRNERGRHSKEGYDICDNTHCLLYFGQDALTNSKQRDIIEQSIKETTRQVISYENKVVPGYFTACCGGLTASPKEVWSGKYLNSYVFKSINCNYCQKDRFYQWERSTKTKAIWKALKQVLTFEPTENTKLIAKYNSNGVVISLLIKERNHQIKVSSAKFRHLVGQELGWNLVLSNFYKIIPKGQEIIFQGKGFGHNLGLCLAGANEQARQGFSYSEILNFYFPNTTLSEVQ